MDIVVIPDQHAHPDYPNDRFDWLGQYLADTKPDVVVNLGDAADMASISGYDKGKRSFYGKSYAKDIDSHLDAQERLWAPLKRLKKKMPHSIILEGNHEHRIEKALDASPELEGTISFDDYEFDYFYDDVVRYEGEAPGLKDFAGITFAHYLTSGVLGRPISGEHPAHSIISKLNVTAVVGHSHTTDYSYRTTPYGAGIQALVAGCYFDYDPQWAGKQTSSKYWRGIIRLKTVQDGFDPEWVSLERLKDAYGHRDIR